MTQPAADWDREYSVIADSDLLPDLARQAIGEEYPHELRPYGWTTRSLLRELGNRLSLAEGQILLDLGAGEGGPGWWLAHQFGVHLIALDFSAEALRSAGRLAQRLRDRAGLAVSPRRAERLPRSIAPSVTYWQATFTETGLDSAGMDAVICLDALAYYRHRVSALREVRRVLRPGGRLALTALETTSGPVGPDDVTDYRALAGAAGLRVVHHGHTPGWPDAVQRTFQLWLDHAAEIHAEFEPSTAATLLAEAADVVARMAERQHILLIAQRVD